MAGTDQPARIKAVANTGIIKQFVCCPVTKVQFDDGTLCA